MGCLRHHSTESMSSSISHTVFASNACASAASERSAAQSWRTTSIDASAFAFLVRNVRARVRR
jgi:hypothetical protein